MLHQYVGDQVSDISVCLHTLTSHHLHCLFINLLFVGLPDFLRHQLVFTLKITLKLRAMSKQHCGIIYTM